MDKFTEGSSIFYKGYSLKKYLASYASSFYIDSHSINERYRKVIKSFLWPLSFFGSFLIGRVSYKENNSVESGFKPQYLFVICYPEKHRAFPVLNNLIEAIEDKSDILVVTNCEDVYKYYSLKNIKCIYLRISGLVFDKSLVYENSLNSEKSFILSKVKLYFDYIEIFMRKFEPSFTLTICDLQTYEKIFTEVANKIGSTTITHQHGQMAKTNFLWNYTISDFIVVWGERTKKNWIDSFKNTEIVVFGTDIFQDLIEEKEKYTREFITLALNPRSDELNKYLIDKVCLQMKNLSDEEKKNYSLVLKLHPEMNYDYWSGIFLKVIDRHSLEMNSHVYTYENKLVLNKSKILIVLSSSIVLQAFISDVSVISINSPSNLYVNPFVYFSDLPESVVKIENVTTEIQSRLNNESYNNKILIKQHRSLREEIAYFDSSKREVEWINKMLSEK